MDEDEAAARDALRPLLAQRLREGGPQMEAIGIAAEVAAHADDADDAWVRDDWIDRLTVCGTPEQCAASIATLAEAGADAVILVPPSPSVEPEALRSLAASR
jgi:alkanesulfonate monooxygenase SsuD/methylene tetrahydromethanopterin reductase-like flavin-dependent oxidoreductase (luciferase family)